MTVPDAQRNLRRRYRNLATVTFIVYVTSSVLIALNLFLIAVLELNEASTTLIVILDIGTLLLHILLVLPTTQIYYQASNAAKLLTFQLSDDVIRNYLSSQTPTSELIEEET